jgi:rod shape-determining protein MreD
MSFTRGMAFIAVAYLLLIVSGAVRALLPWSFPVPDVTLVVVLYLGLGGRGSAPAHAGVALTIGYLTDLWSGAPRGLYALSFVMVMLLARAAASRLMVSRVWQEMVVTLVVALGHGALVVALASPMYDGEALSALRQVPGSSLVTALLVAPLLFRLLRRVDRKLAPDPRTLRIPGL